MLRSCFSSLDGWTWVALVGAVLVVPGVILESAEYIIKWAEKRKFLRFIRFVIGPPSMLEYLCVAKTLKRVLLPVETLGFAILVIGLAVEIFGSFKSDEKQSRKNAELILEAGNATNTAAQAMAMAAKFNFDAAEARREAEMMRSNNLELQKELEPRVLTFEQISNFIFLTKFITNIPVKVSYVVGRSETASFAYQIRNMLNQAGFPAETNAGQMGIDQDSSRIWIRLRQGDVHWPSIVLLAYGTNTSWNPNNYAVERDGQFRRPYLPSETNNIKIGEAILDALNQIGIAIEEERSSHGNFEPV